mmetsp:Transcript_2496/g.5910  ORF Transcript_2496/g.5910 Transcript_2496/m.5910 type:complete len:265 (+) Transcript_2496:2208-3002(+)
MKPRSTFSTTLPLVKYPSLSKQHVSPSSLQPSKEVDEQEVERPIRTEGFDEFCVGWCCRRSSFSKSSSTVISNKYRPLEIPTELRTEAKSWLKPVSDRDMTVSPSVTAIAFKVDVAKSSFAEPAGILWRSSCGASVSCSPSSSSAAGGCPWSFFSSSMGSFWPFSSGFWPFSPSSWLPSLLCSSSLVVACSMGASCCSCSFSLSFSFSCSVPSPCFLSSCFSSSFSSFFCSSCSFFSSTSSAPLGGAVLGSSDSEVIFYVLLMF